MILIADAAPIIFLAKVENLFLIKRVFPVDIIIPAAVKKEIIAPPITPHEERIISQFLKNCQILNIDRPKQFSQSLSFADNCILALAEKMSSDYVLSDDKLLRRITVLENRNVTGTPGIILRSIHKSFISKNEAKILIRELINKHKFRISIEVYDEVMNLIDTL